MNCAHSGVFRRLSRRNSGTARCGSPRRCRRLSSNTRAGGRRPIPRTPADDRGRRRLRHHPIRRIVRSSSLSGSTRFVIWIRDGGIIPGSFHPARRVFSSPTASCLSAGFAKLQPDSVRLLGRQQDRAARARHRLQPGGLQCVANIGETPDDDRRAHHGPSGKTPAGPREQQDPVGTRRALYLPGTMPWDLMTLIAAGLLRTFRSSFAASIDLDSALMPAVNVM